MGETGTSETVAVIDDDPGVSRALGRLLRSVGVDVALFASGEEFLANRNGHRYALLVVDVVMAEVGGLDVLEALAAGGESQRAVVITAQDTDVTRERARRLGAPLLHKPVEGDALLAIVGDAIGRNLAA